MLSLSKNITIKKKRQDNAWRLGDRSAGFPARRLVVFRGLCGRR
jgi:hypothetical protein